jgi:hypothetical protein
VRDASADYLNLEITPPGTVQLSGYPKKNEIPKRFYCSSKMARL